MPKTFQFLKLQGGKALAALLATIFIGLATVGGTVAYLIAKTDVLTNLFTPATIAIEVSADGSAVENTGDAEVFVRLTFVPTWKSTSNADTILATKPEITVTMPTGVEWFLGTDGYYYLKAPLEKGNSVSVPTAAPVGTAPAGYALSVEVMADAIQSAPAEAVLQSWGMSIDANGNLVIGS